MLCNTRPVVPAVHSFERSFASAITLDSLSGFVILEKNKHRHTQVSVKWITFFNVAGFLVYFSEFEIGIGVVKNGKYLYSLSSVSLDNFFSVSDVDYNRVILGRANLSTDGKVIVITATCHYGDKILVSSWGSVLKDLVIGGGDVLSNPNVTLSSESWKDENGNTNGAMYEISYDTDDAVDGKKLTTNVNKKHIQDLNSVANSKLPTDSYNIVTFNVSGKIYAAALLKESFDIIPPSSNDDNADNSSDSASLSWGIKDESFGNVELSARTIQILPPFDDYNSHKFTRIELDDGMYIYSTMPRAILFQTYSEGKIKDFVVSISEKVAETDAETEIEFSIPLKDDGTLVPSIEKEVSEVESENSFYSTNISYNTDEFLIKTGKNEIKDIEGVIGILSFAPIIIYR